LSLRFSSSQLDCASAADEVHDDGNKGKNEQQVNEKAADMQNKEAAQPKHNQNNRQNEKHEIPSFLEQIAAPSGKW
jgi:hypothetical protein